MNRQQDNQKALREFLQDSLMQGKLKNPQYSLRALARKAGLSPAALSEILNGKRRVSLERAKSVLERLGAGLDKIDDIISDIDKGTVSSKKTYQLAIDQFYLISEWYNFAILSLAETEDFDDDPNWIAERLNISAVNARKSLERLERLGALKRNRKGQLVTTGTQLATPDEIANRGLRQQHLEILEKCKDSLEQNQVHERDFLGVTMTLDPQDLPLAKKSLREFMVKFCSRFEKGKKKEVYRLNLQFIPLTVLKEGKKK